VTVPVPDGVGERRRGHTASNGPPRTDSCSSAWRARLLAPPPPPPPPPQAQPGDVSVDQDGTLWFCKKGHTSSRAAVCRPIVELHLEGQWERKHEQKREVT